MNKRLSKFTAIILVVSMAVSAFFVTSCGRNQETGIIDNPNQASFATEGFYDNTQSSVEGNDISNTILGYTYRAGNGKAYFDLPSNKEWTLYNCGYSDVYGCNSNIHKIFVVSKVGSNKGLYNDLFGDLSLLKDKMILEESAKAITSFIRILDVRWIEEEERVFNGIKVLDFTAELVCAYSRDNFYEGKSDCTIPTRGFVFVIDEEPVLFFGADAFPNAEEADRDEINRLIDAIEQTIRTER